MNLLRAIKAAIGRLRRGHAREERRRQRHLRVNNYQYAIRLTWRLRNQGRQRIKAQKRGQGTT